MTSAHFTVRGAAAPQGSKRPVRLGSGKIGLVESSKAVGPWREAVRGETQRNIIEPFTGPVTVRLTFIMRRPAGHYRTGKNAHLLRDGAPRYPAGTPDLDKLCRAVLDGLTEGGAWKDDGQVVTLHARKVYELPGEVPGCDIIIGEVYGS